jgi:hypothetical protein
MSLVEPPLPKPGDDLDGLLRAFFRSRMPHPWPALRLPRFRMASAPRPPSSGRSLIRSRYALAASVALLLFGSLLLPGRLTPGSKPGQVPDAPMIGDLHEQQRMKREHKIKEHENKNKPALGADDDFEKDLGL